MSGIICAALRDLDPVVGGAEMSLSLLLLDPAARTVQGGQPVRAEE